MAAREEWQEVTDTLQRIEDPLLEEEAAPSGPSVIERFYSGKCVLVTGATGFLGAVFLEKLLRSCPNLDKIYILIRGENPASRLARLLQDPLFERLRKERPALESQLRPIHGDVSLHNLDLKEEDLNALKENVQIIFHGAATVKFTEKLHIAAETNIRGTVRMLDLARQCPRLLAFVHISTAFSNCVHKHIEERIYEPAVPLQDMLHLLRDGNYGDERQILLDYPNTYVFTKQIAENVVQTLGEGLSVAIFRPSIVVSTYKEPIAGWASNLYGPMGALVGAGTGVLRVQLVDADATADLVPADMCAAALVAIGWRAATTPPRPATVYNYCSGPQAPITWGQFMDSNKKYGINNPTIKAIWYYSFRMIKSRLLFLVYTILLHFLPAVIVDSFLYVTGRKTRMVRLYLKIHRFCLALSFFSLGQWQFDTDNMQGLWRQLSAGDRRRFLFNLAELDWEQHASTQLLGLRVYLVKDPLSTLPPAQLKWRRLYLLHRAVQFFALFILALFLYLCSSFVPLL